jgi:hypothetical protein
LFKSMDKVCQLIYEKQSGDQSERTEWENRVRAESERTERKTNIESNISLSLRRIH